jgi:hypothetical protein
MTVRDGATTLKGSHRLEDGWIFSKNLRAYDDISNEPNFGRIHLTEQYLLQSRQSAKLFLQSSEFGLPQPVTRWRVFPPGSGGGGHTRWRERGGESPNFDEGTYTVVLFIYTYFALHLNSQICRHCFKCLPHTMHPSILFCPEDELRYSFLRYLFIYNLLICYLC